MWAIKRGFYDFFMTEIDFFKKLSAGRNQILHSIIHLMDLIKAKTLWHTRVITMPFQAAIIAGWFLT
jgi:hypothetical protein